jgi:hypothetical protein
MAETFWEQERRLTPSEALWFAVLDQACADAGSRRQSVRLDAARWWASDMPDLFCRLLDIPRSKLERLKAQRGGLRCARDLGDNGRKLGVRVAWRWDYRAERCA